MAKSNLVASTCWAILVYTLVRCQDGENTTTPASPPILVATPPPPPANDNATEVEDVAAAAEDEAQSAADSAAEAGQNAVDAGVEAVAAVKLFEKALNGTGNADNATINNAIKAVENAAEASANATDNAEESQAKADEAEKLAQDADELADKTGSETDKLAAEAAKNASIDAGKAAEGAAGAAETAEELVDAAITDILNKTAETIKNGIETEGGGNGGGLDFGSIMPGFLTMMIENDEEEEGGGDASPPNGGDGSAGIGLILPGIPLTETSETDAGGVAPDGAQNDGGGGVGSGGFGFILPGKGLAGMSETDGDEADGPNPPQPEEGNSNGGGGGNTFDLSSIFGPAFRFIESNGNEEMTTEEGGEIEDNGKKEGSEKDLGNNEGGMGEKEGGIGEGMEGGKGGEGKEGDGGGMEEGKEMGGDNDKSEMMKSWRKKLDSFKMEDFEEVMGMRGPPIKEPMEGEELKSMNPKGSWEDVMSCMNYHVFKCRTMCGIGPRKPACAKQEIVAENVYYKCMGDFNDKCVFPKHMLPFMEQIHESAKEVGFSTMDRMEYLLLAAEMGGMEENNQMGTEGDGDKPEGGQPPPEVPGGESGGKEKRSLSGEAVPETRDDSIVRQMQNILSNALESIKNDEGLPAEMSDGMDQIRTYLDNFAAPAENMEKQIITGEANLNIKSILDTLARMASDTVTGDDIQAGDDFMSGVRDAFGSETSEMLEAQKTNEMVSLGSYYINDLLKQSVEGANQEMNSEMYNATEWAGNPNSTARYKRMSMPMDSDSPMSNMAGSMGYEDGYGSLDGYKRRMGAKDCYDQCNIDSFILCASGCEFPMKSNMEIYDRTQKADIICMAKKYYEKQKVKSCQADEKMKAKLMQMAQLELYEMELQKYLYQKLTDGSYDKQLEFMAGQMQNGM